MPRKRGPSFDPVVAAVVGDVIRAERVRLGIAQDQFALVAGVDRSYYGKLERGERQPSISMLLRMAGGLGLSASKLMAKVEAKLESLDS